MTLDSLHNVEEHAGRWFGVTLALLVAYQLLGVFYGLDLCDAGFYLTFYDNFFTAPETVEYNFMYYLNGLIGGALQWLFPSMGILGMRLAGVAFNTLTAVVVWRMLRGVVPAGALVLGIAAVVVSFVQPPYTLCYDLCTALFYVLAMSCLLRGITRDSLLCIALAGFLAGLNVFVRIPNVVGLSMLLVVFIDRFYHAVPWHRTWLAVASFLAGVIAAVAVMVAVMMALGHWPVFLEVLDDLREMAADTSGTASHTTGQMIMSQLTFYGMALWTGVKLAAPILVYLLCAPRSGQRWLRYVLLAGCLLVEAWFVLRMRPVLPLWMMCLTGCLWAIVRGERPLRLAAWLGLCMLLAFPIGSDGAAYNNGSIIAWIAAPVAGVLWARRRLIPFVALFLAACAVMMVKDGAYFDGGNLLAKRSTVDCDRATAVFTTQERAQVVTTLLHGIAPHVQPGDTLMAYGSLPTINYLTRTRPAIGCSWVEQLSTSALERRLSKLGNSRPAVLRQKFNTIGPEWSQPSTDYLQHYNVENPYQNDSKLVVLNDFLSRNNYRVVYEDTHFVLLKP